MYHIHFPASDSAFEAHLSGALSAAFVARLTPANDQGDDYTIEAISAAERAALSELGATIHVENGPVPMSREMAEKIAQRVEDIAVQRDGCVVVSRDASRGYWYSAGSQPQVPRDGLLVRIYSARVTADQILGLAEEADAFLEGR